MSPLIVTGAHEIEQGSREFSEMYTDTQPKFRTVATAFAAATIYTGLLLTVSTSPARAAAPADRDFVRNVETQIARTEWAPSTKTGVATIAVRLDAEGKVSSATVAGSTGHAALDREALNTARSVAYPKTGRARTVAVVLTYGDAKKPSKLQSAALVGRYVNAKGEALAAETLAPNVG